jgi:hypothetical protein
MEAFFDWARRKDDEARQRRQLLRLQSEAEKAKERDRQQAPPRYDERARESAFKDAQLRWERTQRERLAAEQQRRDEEQQKKEKQQDNQKRAEVAFQKWLAKYRERQQRQRDDQAAAAAAAAAAVNAPSHARKQIAFNDWCAAVSHREPSPAVDCNPPWVDPVPRAADTSDQPASAPPLPATHAAALRQEMKHPVAPFLAGVAKCSARRRAAQNENKGETGPQDSDAAASAARKASVRLSSSQAAAHTLTSLQPRNDPHHVGHHSLGGAPTHKGSTVEHHELAHKRTELPTKRGRRKTPKAKHDEVDEATAKIIPSFYRAAMYGQH